MFWLLMASTWICYIGYAIRVRKGGGLHWSVWFFLFPLVPVGLFLDFTLNMAMTLPFWDFPQELLLTKRLHRYREEGKRRRVAKFICERWLNPFDQTGQHC